MAYNKVHNIRPNFSAASETFPDIASAKLLKALYTNLNKNICFLI